MTDFSATQGIAETSPLFVGASAVIRRGLRPTIGVQCGPSMTAYKPFAGNLKKLRRVGPSWAPMRVDLRIRFYIAVANRPRERAFFATANSISCNWWRMPVTSVLQASAIG